MKLIRNTEYDTIFKYFQGVVDPHGWTLESPAIWDAVKEDYYGMSVANFKIYALSEKRYLVFKCRANFSYTMRVHNDVVVQCRLFDYEEYLNDPTIIENSDFSYYLSIMDASPAITFDKDTLVLASFFLDDEWFFEQDIPIGFNLEPMVFNYTSRYYRDWKNRIAESTWDVTGKVLSVSSLDEISRRAE